MYDSIESNNQNTSLIFLLPILQPIQNNDNKNDDNIQSNNTNSDANNKDNNLVHPYQGAMTEKTNDLSETEQHNTHKNHDQNEGAHQVQHEQTNLKPLTIQEARTNTINKPIIDTKNNKIRNLQPRGI